MRSKLVYHASIGQCRHGALQLVAWELLRAVYLRKSSFLADLCTFLSVWSSKSIFLIELYRFELGLAAISTNAEGESRSASLFGVCICVCVLVSIFSSG